MKIFEIEYEYTNKHVLSQIAEIHSNVLNKFISKIDAIEQAEELKRSLELEIQLSDLDPTEKLKYSPLKLLINILIYELNQI